MSFAGYDVIALASHEQPMMAGMWNFRAEMGGEKRRVNSRVISAVGVDGGRSCVSSVNNDSVFTFIRNIAFNVCSNNSINLIRMIQNTEATQNLLFITSLAPPLIGCWGSRAISRAEVQHYPRKKSLLPSFRILISLFRARVTLLKRWRWVICDIL